jgi:hypothetical protein
VASGSPLAGLIVVTALAAVLHSHGDTSYETPAQIAPAAADVDATARFPQALDRT